MLPSFAVLFSSVNRRLSAAEAVLTRRENVLIFLIIRFVLMTGCVLGFAWTLHDLTP